MNAKQKQQVKSKWSARIESGEKIELKWDAGGDETLVWVSANGVEIEWSQCDDLVDLVIEVLDLPNTGEYFVNGGGELQATEGKLLIKHESKHCGIEYPFEEGKEFDPETFDFEENATEVEKTVNETVVLI